MPEAVRLKPSLREKVWGKERISPWFPDATEPIGEAWYLADRELPLLVKLIFTSERLSIQVHPDDGEDGPRGKTEMWHILEAEPGATIAMGFGRPIDKAELAEATRSGEIERLVNWLPVKAGETYFMPAHTVHAIGAGIVLCEIQQHSDVTYRLWDYGRPRPLHVEQALPIADLTVHPGAVKPVPLGDGREELVRCKYFVTELVRLAAGASETPESRACQLWIAIEGNGCIGAQTYGRGDVWLLPEEGAQPEIRSTTASRFLRTWVPVAQCDPRARFVPLLPRRWPPTEPRP
jgi:mannose-6-phosphate isomerase